MEQVTLPSSLHETAHGREVRFSNNERIPFSAGEYLRRLDFVLQSLREDNLDALLVRSPENITYLSGYETPGYYGYHCLLLTRHDAPVLIGRKVEVISNAPEFSWLSQLVFIEDHETAEDVVAGVISSSRLQDKRLGVEKSGFFFTVREFEALQQRLPKATFIDCSTLVESARMIKSDEEVEMIRRAARITDHSLLAGVAAVAAGVTEDQIAGALYKAWCEAGAEYTGLPNFIVSGPRAGVCHATWRGRRLEQNDFCIMEIAASKNRYAAALFRGVAVGEPKPMFLKLARTTEEGLQAALSSIKAGAICEDVDREVHAVFEAQGFGYQHKSRLAYSMGVNYPPDWGEGQIISIRRGERRALQANMCFHVVPGCMIYEEGIGMCTSATVRVTSTGCEVLNTVEQKLFRK